MGVPTKLYLGLSEHLLFLSFHSIQFCSIPDFTITPLSATAFFCVLATSGYNSGNLASQSESRIQILLLLDWMTQFLLLQQDVARTWKNAVHCSKKVMLGCWVGAREGGYANCAWYSAWSHSISKNKFGFLVVYRACT